MKRSRVRAWACQCRNGLVTCDNRNVMKATLGKEAIIFPLVEVDPLQKQKDAVLETAERWGKGKATDEDLGWELVQLQIRRAMVEARANDRTRISSRSKNTLAYQSRKGAAEKRVRR